MTLTKKLNITKLHISSEVQCRFATTEINSRVENVSEQSEEAEFVANLPEGAFITYFEMEIDGKVIVGDVKEKQEAKMVYNAAKSRGETAGHVAQAARETNTFNISVNIAQYSFAKFKLVYQELLQRVRGAYKHQINVHPGQTVEDLQVTVTIKENNPINILHVPTFAAKLSDKSCKELLLLKGASDIQIDRISESEMTVTWHPSAINQSKYLTNDILDGQLIVLYDVDRKDDQVLVVDGHFIHFLAPKNLEIGSKNIVFALDISGSMGIGGKLEQTKTAMRSILNQLRPTDQFSILCFDTELEVWKKKPVLATKENVSEAIGFVDAQRSRGGTDIDRAVQEGIKWLKAIHSEHLLASILVLLTDGEHNNGYFTSQQITPRVESSLRDGGQNIKIYGLGFGEGADFNLLRKMSSKTGGFARKIYAASDAAVQLDSFYAEISSPLLTDLNINYINPNVEVVSTVQNNHGDTLFDGSEFVIIGKMNQLLLKDGEEIFEWRTRSCRGPKIYKCCYRPWRILPNSNKGEIAKTAGNFIERSWAYLTVKNLLEKAKIDSDESTTLKKQALQLALRYKFVTELTSMVVTQEKNVHELDQIQTRYRSDGHLFPFPAAQHSNSIRFGAAPTTSFFGSTGRTFGSAMRAMPQQSSGVLFGSPMGAMPQSSGGYAATSAFSFGCQGGTPLSSSFGSPMGAMPQPSSGAGFGSPVGAMSQPSGGYTTPTVFSFGSTGGAMSQAPLLCNASRDMSAVRPQQTSIERDKAMNPSPFGGRGGEGCFPSSETASLSNKWMPSYSQNDLDYLNSVALSSTTNSISKMKKTEKNKVEHIAQNKACMQLSALVGLEAEKLEEMCEDQPPTLIEKLMNTPIDQAISAVTKLIGENDTIAKEYESNEICLLILVATLITSKLPNSASIEDMIKLLFDKTTNAINIEENGTHQFIVECSAGQLAPATSILLAIQTMVRLNRLCSIQSQNQLVQFLSVAVGSMESGALETLAKQVITAIDA